MRRLVFSVLLISSTCLGQGISNLWPMGYSCCSTNYGGMDIDFGSGAASFVLKQRYMNFYETVGAISNSNGNLLFTSNGIYVANALDDTMQNGMGLNPSAYTTSMVVNGLAIPQGNLVIPFPGDSTRYYLFHETDDDDHRTNVTMFLYYSVIDMRLDGGLGAVVQKNSVLFHDSLVPGRITATKHANGRDWWLFVHEYNTSNAFTFLITPQGISTPIQHDLFNPRGIWFGQALFSPQGDKFVYYEPYNDLDIFDFDRCTGTFSHFVHININDSAFAGGAAFSPSGRYLYLSSVYEIYQFDLQASPIVSSKTTVGVYDNYQEQGFYQAFYLAALAPDGKIYINCTDGSKYFHVINAPDSAGLACNFVQRGLPLPRWDAFTMPNYPNYFLGADANSLCDTLSTGIAAIQPSVAAYSVFPNPVRDQLFITHSLKEPVQRITLVNSLGQVQDLPFNTINNGEYLQIDFHNFSKGIYYLQLTTKTQVVSRKVVK